MMTASSPVHRIQRPSYLSSERMWHEKHTGLINLMVSGCFFFFGALCFVLAGVPGSAIYLIIAVLAPIYTVNT